MNKVHNRFALLKAVSCLWVQKEKEVLALLSRLDLNNVHFTNTPPGIVIIFNSILLSFISTLPTRGHNHGLVFL